MSYKLDLFTSLTCIFGAYVYASTPSIAENFINREYGEVIYTGISTGMGAIGIGMLLTAVQSNKKSLENKVNE